MSHRFKTFVDRCIYDQNDRVTIFQLPNLPLVVFIVASTLAKLFDHCAIDDLLKVVAFGAIFTWSWLEIFDGVNYFRRVLGLVVLILSVMTAIGLLNR